MEGQIRTRGSADAFGLAEKTQKLPLSQTARQIRRTLKERVSGFFMRYCFLAPEYSQGRLIIGRQVREEVPAIAHLRVSPH